MGYISDGENMMETKILEILLPHLTHWGYYIIILMTFLETSAFLGLLVPGESVVVIAGLLASKGVLELGDVIWAASLGAIMGDTVGYFIGHKFGAGFFLKYGRYFFFKQEYLTEARQFFDKHGGKTVFFGRFIAWLRSFAPVVAGISKMRYSKFLSFNAAGGIAWAAIFSVLGYFVGNSWEIIKAYLGHLGVLGFIAGTAFLYAYFLFTKKRRLIQGSIGWINGRASSHIPRTWEFVKGRLSTGEWYGMNLTIGLALFIIALLSFGEIAEDVIDKETLFHLDFRIQMLIERIVSPGVTRFMVEITNFGGTYIVIITIAAIIGYLMHRRDWWSLFALFLAAGLGEILLALLKLTFHRPRPAHYLTMAHGCSFPSGHAFSAMIVYGFLIYMAWKFSRNKALTSAISGILMFLIVLIGVSRIYLNVHWLTDVLGGYAMGLAWLVLSVIIADAMKQMTSTEAKDGEAFSSGNPCFD
jgi:membrane protein DedA with SNARE-associated domain/membrane-associated phospholipid phosphatase